MMYIPTDVKYISNCTITATRPSMTVYLIPFTRIASLTCQFGEDLAICLQWVVIFTKLQRNLDAVSFEFDR